MKLILMSQVLEMCPPVVPQPRSNEVGAAEPKKLAMADAIDVNKFSELCRAHHIGRPPPLGSRAIDEQFTNATPFKAAEGMQISQFLEVARWSTVQYSST